MIELSRYVVEPLRKDENFILYRGRSRYDASQILVLSPLAEYPAPEILKRLEHEYSLNLELDPTWATRPIAMARHRERTVLVLGDPGGVPLDQLLGQPLEVSFSLRLAISLSRAIDHLHQRDIIHKDIKPANVLVNSVTGRCWLTGFGIASRLPRERQSPEPPEFVAGTLAYMAPEQTVRMNRSIDSRSDLHSLGATLYEVLTGSLPFAASDPMEWVHCHIARQPVFPSVRLKTVPILCLPLINQAKLIAVLYLENNLTPHVFTPARIAVLKLLASQAAISLENTCLYRGLEEREAKIRRLVDANIIGILIWNLEGEIIDAA